MSLPRSDQRRRRSSGARAKPAFVTGTSSEFLGKRPLPRILRERGVVIVLGPAGSGKTEVAKRLARGAPLRLDTQQLESLVVDRVGAGRWHDKLVAAPSLVLDGPVWLQNRPGVVAQLCELLQLRLEAGHQTVVCQSDHDGSVDLLMECVAPGAMVVLGLRFPKGERGRLRFARRICDQKGIPRVAARGTHHLDPWGYAEVIAYLDGWSEDTSPPASSNE